MWDQDEDLPDIEFTSENDAGEPVVLSMKTTNAEYLDKIVAFTAGSDQRFGKLYCFWQVDSALTYVRSKGRELADELIRRWKVSAYPNDPSRSEGTPTDEEIEKHLDEVVAKANGGLAAYAAEVFLQAQITLVGNVLLKLFEEASVTVKSPYEERTFFVFDKKSKVEMREDLKRLSQDWHNRRLGVRRGGDRRSRADLGQLGDYYDRDLEDWREAFRICRDCLASRSQSRKAEWRSEVKRAFPALPDDLVERLQPMTDWPENISDICLEQGGEDKAEDIAFERAARSCGAEPYAYKLSSLQETYRKQKRQNQSAV